MKKLIFIILIITSFLGYSQETHFLGVDFPTATHQGDTASIQTKIPIFNSNNLLNSYLNVGDLNGLVGTQWGNIPGTLSDQTDLQNALDDKIDTSEKGANNGVATLDNDGKLPTSQIPESLLGAVNYQGNYNANTNTPTLSNPPSASTKGFYYVVTVSGTQFGTFYDVGDWIISNGSEWQIVENNNDVTSVFTRKGDVTAQEGDYQSFYPRLSQSYSNPTWISSLAWGKLSGTPTTIAGYGITDAYTKSEGNSRYLLSVGNTTKTSGDLTFNDGSSPSFGTNGNSRIFGSSNGSTYWDLSTGNLEFRDGTTNRFTFGRTTGNLTVTGNITGNIGLFSGSVSPLRLSGSGTGDANTNYMQFFESNGSTRQGYLGFSSGSNSDFFMVNDVSGNHLRLVGTGGINSLQFYDGTTSRIVWHSGNLNPSSYVPTSRTITAGTGLTGGGNLSANRTISANFGTTAGTVSEGNHTHTTSDITNLSSYTGFDSRYLLSVGNTTKTSGDLTFNDGSSPSFGTNGNSRIFGSSNGSTYWDLSTGNLEFRDGTTNRFTFGRTTGNIIWTGIASGNGSGITNVNADLLDGINSTNFARTDISNETFSGTITATNFILSSDKRLKENIESIGNGYYTFNYKSDSTKTKRYGVIAQEVEKYAPSLVVDGEDGYKKVAYIDLLILKQAKLEKRVAMLEAEKNSDYYMYGVIVLLFGFIIYSKLKK